MKDGFRILTDLSKVPAGSNCALLIRHGDRNGALAKVVNEQEGLNEIGTKRSKQLRVNPVLEAGGPLHQVRPLAYQLAEVADVLARDVRAGYQVRSEQVSQRSGVDLVRPHLASAIAVTFKG
jgi:hypothetical protein